MLVTEQRHSTLLPSLAILGIFTLGFISSASILYALDPKDTGSIHHTPSISSIQNDSDPTSQDSKSETNQSSNVIQEKPKQVSSNQTADIETEPTLRTTPRENSSEVITREPTPEVTTPVEQPEDATTSTRRGTRRHKPLVDLFELYGIELNSFLGIRI